MNNNEQDVQIGKIDVRLGNVEDKVDKIVENHLPHIQEKIDKVHDRQNYWGGALAILAILVPFIMSMIFK